MAEKNSFVVDSSVVAKWYLSEPGTDAALAIRDAFATRKLDLKVPTLLVYEVVNALRFSGAFSAVELALAARSLSRYRFEFWRPRGKLLEMAANMSMVKGVTVYDACYVALASIKKCKVITEDREVIEKFPALTTPLADIPGTLGPW